MIWAASSPGTYARQHAPARHPAMERRMGGTA
eukprot:CAMPEP_0185549336 /NCGR_PEP_ID=MMETSP1381-20130426/15449_1 /TAXON_ID=298111 /ORGANISM="Pavlova sp., Strain CCMP459" /LENGTH=31 /DNA_ID= /DNA_START= /DNA_END= /DNA_ORIENTATION=